MRTCGIKHEASIVFVGDSSEKTHLTSIFCSIRSIHSILFVCIKEPSNGNMHGEEQSFLDLTSRQMSILSFK